MFEEYDAFIFDMDGTLVNSGKLHEQAWLETLRIFGIPEDRALMRSLSGVSTQETLRILLKKFGIKTNRSIDEMTAHKESYVINNLANDLRPTKLNELVERWAGKVPMSVGTGANTGEAEAILEQCGLRHYMTFVIGADRVANHKPAPDTFLLCAELMDVKPSKCVVFEDSPLGLRAGEEAKMKVIDVSKEFQIDNNYFL
jgi:beta-phosphoglucomutase family hydrolase